MKKYLLFPVILAAFLLPVASFAQYNKPAIDSIGVPGPLLFQNISYGLARSSYTPDSTSYNTYKQEYIAAGDTLDTYKTMLILYIYTGNVNMDTLANAKVDELRELQLTNAAIEIHPFSNKKTGELMIDFLTTENSDDGQYINMAERNVYRYEEVTAKSGQACVLLFAVSKRSYGDDVAKFMDGLKSKARVDLIKAVGQFKIPEITIVK